MNSAYNISGNIFPVLAAISDKTENEKVFGFNTYKLLVLVADLPAEKVRKMLCRHIASLRASSKRRATKPVMDDVAELMDFHHMSVSDNLFPSMSQRSSPRKSWAPTLLR